MKCKQVQDLILTDYQDGLLSSADREALLDHVAQCPECRALFADVDEFAVQPFSKSSIEMVPEGTWDAIHSQIEIEKRKVSETVLERILNTIRVFTELVPKPVFGLSAVLAGTLILVFNLSVFMPQMKTEEVATISPIMSMVTVDTTISLDEEVAFGSVMEEFFL